MCLFYRVCIVGTLTTKALADGLTADQNARFQVHGQSNLENHALREEVPLIAISECANLVNLFYYFRSAYIK